MTAFWTGAAVLSAAACAFLLFPLWRQRRRAGRWSLAGVAAAIATAPLAAGLYLHTNNWDPEAARHASEGARLVAQLAERLQADPDDVRGWRLLANSYMSLGQYTQGRAAFAQVWARTPAPDNELKVSFAEAQVLTDRSALTGSAGRLIEEVLAAESSNPKALWYGGLAARELGREDAARARWTRLLELELPDAIRDVVQTELLALAPAGGAEEGGPRAAHAAGPSIRLRVDLGEGLSIEQLGPRASLFIFARAAGGGPPVAVIRQPANAVPGEFTLSDANSMIPGRSLADFEELTLVARLSASGEPTEQPGDWYAQTEVRPSDDAVAVLVIDQVVQ